MAVEFEVSHEMIRAGPRQELAHRMAKTSIEEWGPVGIGGRN
jgi:hypothetical protein